ncbi:MAG TPA: rhomboid family intramembrane serine protease [Opitutaceae bacterium]|nr:rhomboid family intramembrane serine protease [Opitutaceae bacterium]
METEPSAAADISIAVEYEHASGVSNRDLAGKGYFLIGATEPRFRFSGQNRKWQGRTTTLEFRSDQIWNALVDGPRVQFEIRTGRSGSDEAPFVFFCATPEAAADAARQLPQTKDDEFFSRRSFSDKLSALPGATGPWSSVTNLIIAANFAVFVVMGFFGAGWFEPASMRPYVLYVANNAGATTDGEWWRIVTCMFVHYGLIHLLLNLWALFQTGHFVERLLGRTLYTLAYFGSGIIASFVSLFWNGDKVWSAGASGAVFGVYGMLLGFMVREKQAVPKSVFQPMLKSTLMFAGYNLLYALANPRIDNAAHVGGFVAGMALGWLVALPLDLGQRARHWTGRFRVGVAAVAVATTAGVIFAPRFNYRFREELAWEESIREPLVREGEISRRWHELAGKIQQGETAAAGDLIRFVETEAIPFYEQWRPQFEAMTLTPGTETDRRRNREITLMQANVANYRQLATDLREKSPVAAIKTYLAAEARALATANAREK